MFVRCARAAGRIVVACFGFGFAVLSLGSPLSSAAASATTPAPTDPELSLLHETSWVQPTTPGSTATLTLLLKGGTSVTPTDQVVVTASSRLLSRSTLEQTFTGTPTGLLDRTAPMSWSTLTPGARGAKALTISIEPTATATPAPAAGSPVLDLHCSSPGSSCTGVYPIEVALENSTGALLDRFTTYLTYAAQHSSHPLLFSWIVPIHAPVVVRSGVQGPAEAIGSMSSPHASALDGLVASLQENPTVPVTLAAAPQTLQQLRATGTDGRHALTTLAGMSTSTPSTRQFLPEPYVPINLGALSGAGEPTEIAAQMEEGSVVLHQLGLQTGSGSGSVTGGSWIATSSSGTALAGGLSQIHADEVVVPGSILASIGNAAGNGTWASTFSLQFAKGGTVPAAEADSELTVHFTAKPTDPALAADQLLADLAMIHFEEPNASSVRGVIAVPPTGWVPSPAFDNELLAGVTDNPVVDPVTLAQFFATVTPNATVPIRHLQNSGASEVFTPALAAKISTARVRLSGFDSAIPGPTGRSILDHFDQLLLDTEWSSFSSAQCSTALDEFEHSLGAQLSLISLGAERTVTLTARTGHIPITVASNSHYTFVGTLTVSGDRFQFQNGASRHMTLDHPTNPVRFQVQARSSGELPLEVNFVSPSDGLVIAHGVMTIRSTSTSAVGIVLTILALLVLVAWWARTWVSGRRKKAVLVRVPTEPVTNA